MQTSFRETLGRIRVREGFPSAGVVSVRELLSHFSLNPKLSIRALAASDLIGERYNQDGRAAGPLGIPMSAVRLTSTGAMQSFSGAIVELRNEKVDPVVSFQTEVRFLGFRCTEESNSDELTSSDEPYFIIAITSIQTNSTHLFGPYDNVDSGESRFTSAGEDVIATVIQPPFTISVIAKEFDHGNAEEASAKVKKAGEDAIKATQSIAMLFGQAQVAVVAVMIGTVFTSIGGFISDAVSSVLGFEDDFIGSSNIRVGDWNDGEDKWRTAPRIIEENPFSSSPYNIIINIGDDNEGKYILYFNIIIKKVEIAPT